MSFPVSPVDRETYKNYMWDEASGAWLKIDAEPVGSLRSRPEPAGVTLPQLPDAWQPASGQYISDPASVTFNGRRIFNFNGADVVLTGLTWTADAGGSYATVPEADRWAIGEADDVTGAGIADDTVVTSMDYATGEVIISDVDATGEIDSTFTNEGKGAVGGDFGSVGNQMQRITGELGRSSLNNVRWSRATDYQGTGAFEENVIDDTGRVVGTSGNDYAGCNPKFNSAKSPHARASATTEGETRPRNRALLYCIKY